MMPIATATAAFMCVVGMMSSDGTSSLDAAFLFAARGWCALAAALSSIILLMHGYGRVLRLPQFDPLRQESVGRLLLSGAYIISLPWRSLRALTVASPFVERFFDF